MALGQHGHLKQDPSLVRGSGQLVVHVLLVVGLWCYFISSHITMASLRPGHGYGHDGHTVVLVVCVVECVARRSAEVSWLCKSRHDSAHSLSMCVDY